VGRLGEGLEVSGWSVDDDIVEAIELPDRRFALGVVWHPEEDEASEIIPALVAAARDSLSAVPYSHTSGERNSGR
jgi:putative glutamine amidotransferase